MSATIVEHRNGSFPRRRLTVEDYHRMAEAGILGEDDRIELIEGELIQMPPIGARHAEVVDYVNDVFSRQAGDDKRTRVQNPVQLGDYGELYPDIAILRKRRYFDAHPGPGDVFLIIEVSDSTLTYDRDLKVPLYAVHGIPEVWLISVTERCIDIFRQPSPAERRYESIQRIERGAVTPLHVPGVSLALSELFPRGPEN
ncbi:MAG: Uma2 family endonuclease [Gammaproteobacteria bacterium]